MGTVIEQLDVTRGGWRTRHSALRLGVLAAKACLRQAGRDPDEVDLLINAGIYRDRNLAEPALAALIQADVGAHPEDPHSAFRIGAETQPPHRPLSNLLRPITVS